MPIETIANRYKTDVAQVHRILRLANLASDIFKALAKGKIDLDIAKAYAGVANKSRQLKVWRDLGHNTSAYSVRRALRQASYSRSDAKVLFIGFDEYIKNGGKVEDDLFLDQTILVNGDIVDTLYETTLKTHIKSLETAGWNTVIFCETREELSAKIGKKNNADFEEKYDDALKARFDDVQQKLAAICESCDNNLWSLSSNDKATYNNLESELRQIKFKARVYSDDVKTHASLFFTLDETGMSYYPVVTPKHVKSPDSKRVDPAKKPLPASLHDNTFKTAGDALISVSYTHLTLPTIYSV